VKRLCPRVAQEALGFALDVTHWPSTVDVAAAPWCQRLLAVAPQDAEAYADAVAKASDHALTGGVSSLLHQAQGGAQRFLRLDANWFQRSFVASSKLAPLSDEGARASVLARLDSLTAARDGAGLGSPAVYFALLLADGDRLGQMVASAGSSPGSVAAIRSRMGSHGTRRSVCLICQAAPSRGSFVRGRSAMQSHARHASAWGRSSARPGRPDRSCSSTRSPSLPSSSKPT
jgi:hypothetical protein